MDEYVNIASINDLVEGQLLDSLLTQRQIPHNIQSYHDPAFDGVFQLQKGWGCVSAPAVHRKTILYLLSDMRKDAARA
jgi:hypothetical protein